MTAEGSLAHQLLREWTALSPEQRDHGAGLPKRMHATLGELLDGELEGGVRWTAEEGARAIVVGDVHGCAEELDLLLEACGFQQGRDVLVLVGDLVHKGPRSCEVVRRVRELGGVSVRGNHDVQSVAACVARRALRAAALSQDGSFARVLSELQEVGVFPTTRPLREASRKRGRAGNLSDGGQLSRDGEEDEAAGGSGNLSEEGQLSRSGEEEEVDAWTGDYAWTDGLTDADILFLATLPASILLPPPFAPGQENGSGEGAPALVVHAGMVPGVLLEEQRPEDLHSMREVQPHSLAWVGARSCWNARMTCTPCGNSNPS
ncbi:Metallo-dependent phosphatase-like protein, partial [Baffinella frigidus]